MFFIVLYTYNTSYTYNTTALQSLLVSSPFRGGCQKVPTSLHLDGKRTGQSLMVTSAPGNPNSHLFFIHDHTSNTCFLMDMGAEVNVSHSSQFDRQHKSSNLTLQAANNTSIRTYSTKLITFNLGLHRSFKWVFIIADHSSGFSL